MSLQSKLTYITPEEYLTIERQADSPSEYFDGEIFAMAGASKIATGGSSVFFRQSVVLRFI
ncbi:MAG: hypothetical protein ABFS56_31425 [Pseudomonadota bacterium]